jgi:putative sterol carrier protein
VDDFLTPGWFDAANHRLRDVSVDVEALGGRESVRVVLEIVDGPAELPHALTFSVNATGVEVGVGDHLAADVVVTVAYDDARALTEGRFDSSSALREGKLKVRGDVNAITSLGAWMANAHRESLD